MSAINSDSRIKAIQGREDVWLPCIGGSTRDRRGHTLISCYNPARNEYAWRNLTTGRVEVRGSVHF